MFRYVVATALLFVAVLVSSPKADAQDMSAALARMDAIIAEMEKLRVEFATLSAQVGSNTTPTPAVQGASATKYLTEDLSYGVTNEDIARIQRLLATDPKIYDHPHITGFFGPKTEEGIKNFQTRFGLSPVGVIGPATTALLEIFFNAYPDENYPAGVLNNKPTPAVQGASVSTVPATPSVPSVTQTSAQTVGAAQVVDVELDRGEAKVYIVYTNGNKRTLLVSGDSEREIIAAIAARTPLSVADIEAVITFDGGSVDEDEDEDEDEDDEYDESDAEDALDDADDEIDDVEDAIAEADDEDEETDWAEDILDEAKDLLDDAEDAFDYDDWDKVVKKAKEAKKLAKEAEDRIGEEENGEKGDSDEIDSIEAEVDDGESEITVEYEDDDDYVFTVEEDKKDEIIEEVAEELNMDEDDVEDLIEFDFGEIESIDALVDEDEDDTSVTVRFDSGVKMRFTVNSADEDDVVEEVADEINERESKVEDVINFDY